MFSLFSSHVELAHHYWERLLQIGDTVIDATCGNGRDTLELAKLVLAKDAGKVIAYDIQKAALEKSRIFLAALFSSL